MGAKEIQFFLPCKSWLPILLPASELTSDLFALDETFPSVRRPCGIIVAVVQSLSHVQLVVTQWAIVRQAPLSFTISQSLLKFMSIEPVTLSNHLTLCHLSPPALKLS